MQKPKNPIIVENLKPNGQRAKNAIALLWIVLVLDVISLASGYLQYDLIQTVASGGEITDETAHANDLREQIIGVTYLIALIVSGVTFIQWFRRAYYNLHLKVNTLSYAEGWAAGAWFVPILNLFRPYQIMSELYKETKILLAQKGVRMGDKISVSLLGFWWTLWILNNIIGQIVWRVPTDTIGELSFATIASMAANIVGIPLALIAIKIVKDYSDVEPYLDELRDEDEILTHLVGVAKI